MKRIIFTICCNIIAVVAVCQTEKEDLSILQSIFGKTKKAILMQYIQLNENDQNGFWKLYDEYENKSNSIGLERVMLINSYASSYDSLDEKTATKLAASFLENTAKSTKLYREYFKKFTKYYGGITAATFVQVETYIQTAIQANLQSQIPIIGELNKQQKSLQ